MLFDLDIVDGTRCANPTQSEVESCNDFGDELCHAHGIVIEERGKNALKVVWYRVLRNKLKSKCNKYCFSYKAELRIN